MKERLTEVRAALETIRSLEENEETDRTLPSETELQEKIAELTEQKQQLEQKYNEQYHAANTNRKTYENVQNQQNQMQALEEEYKWVRGAFGYGVRRHESEIENRTGNVRSNDVFRPDSAKSQPAFHDDE